MQTFILSQISFFITLAIVLFLPGYCLLLSIFGRNESLHKIERFVVSFGLSIVSVDFILFAYSKMSVPITRLSALAGIFIFSLACFVFYKYRSKTKEKNIQPEEKNLFDFSKKQFVLLLTLLFLTFFIKTAYLSGTILPTATDMGHHMYWAKWMTENHALPTYEGMPDFIIGEQTIFGTMSLVGGLDFFSAFPPLVLLLFDLLGILTVFLLAVRIFKNKHVAILAVLFLGVLFAVSSPQAKFVSGGVVGNIMGNFLMPLAFYFYLRAFNFFEEKKAAGRTEKKFMGLAIFVTFGLFYTHHLTAFIFLFIASLSAVLFLLFNFREAKNIVIEILKMFFSPEVFPIFLLGTIFFLFVFTPNYVQISAVDTAVGSPSKDTREGLDVVSLKSSVGEIRLALGFLGALFIFFARDRKKFGYLLAASWAVMIFIMSYAPQLLFIDLPSSRIGNYLSYPLAILSAFGFYFVFKEHSGAFQRTKTLFQASFLLIIAFIFSSGISDSTAAIANKNDSEAMVKTFSSAQYLADRTSNTDKILKDHNYISTDSWMKLFFMRGYKYPDSRGYFKRYEDVTKPREMCTLYMISNPNGPEAKQCFIDTETSFIMINPIYDSIQFQKLKNFNQIYANGGVTIYYKNK